MDVFLGGKFCGIWEFDIVSGDTPIRTNRVTMKDIREYSCKYSAEAIIKSSLNGHTIPYLCMMRFSGVDCDIFMPSPKILLSSHYECSKATLIFFDGPPT